MFEVVLVRNVLNRRQRCLLFFSIDLELVRMYSVSNEVATYATDR